MTFCCIIETFCNIIPGKFRFLQIRPLREAYLSEG
jgi:hypothetical protein